MRAWIVALALFAAAPIALADEVTPASPAGPAAGADFATDITCAPISHYRGERHFVCTFAGSLQRQCAEDIRQPGYMDISCDPTVEARVVHTDATLADTGPARPDFVCGPNPRHNDVEHGVRLMCQFGEHAWRCRRVVNDRFNSLWCESVAWDMSRVTGPANFLERAKEGGSRW